MKSDEELLRCYARGHSEEAFAELVTRHCDLVWGAAHRVLGDADLARDAAQCVFADLARKAGEIPARVVLAGWLYRAACLSAANIARSEKRRTQREHQAMENQEPSQNEPEEGGAAAQLQPFLDACLAELSESDRDAVVLRYLSGRSLAEVGAVFGSSEDAAQKRVARALEKLRDGFRRRGLDHASGVVVAALSLAGLKTAPAGAAEILAATALAGSGSIPTFSLISIMKTKMALQIVAGLAMAGGLVVQQQRLSHLESDNETLQGKLTSAAHQEKQAAPAGGVPDQEELLRARQERDELLRLRGEYAMLKNRPPPSPETEQLKAQLAEARNRLTVQQAETQIQLRKATESGEAMGLSQNVISTLKYIGIYCRLYANDHNGLLPSTLSEIDTSDPNFKKPGSVPLDQFEFVQYDRRLSLSDNPHTIFVREKIPRQMSNGRFMRSYLVSQGSATTLVSDDGNFAVQEANESGGTPPN